MNSLVISIIKEKSHSINHCTRLNTIIIRYKKINISCITYENYKTREIVIKTCKMVNTCHKSCFFYSVKLSIKGNSYYIDIVIELNMNCYKDVVPFRSWLGTTCWTKTDKQDVIVEHLYKYIHISLCLTDETLAVPVMCSSLVVPSMASSYSW